MTTVGSLCTGIEGAELAMEIMGLDPDLRWYSEIDKDACQVLSQVSPGVPNLGDLKLIEWETVEPVDLLVAGYPCQPFSTAGKREGTDDPRHLWPWISCALRILRPALVLLENVAAHLSLGFDTVLRDLAASGFDARWTTFRAADVGACHGRDRLFIVANPCRSGRPEATGSALGEEGGLGRWRSDHVPDGHGAPVRSGGGHEQSPSPDPDAEPVDRERPRQELGEGSEVASDARGKRGGSARNMTANRTNPDSQHHSGTTLSDVAVLDTWGKYADSIKRWVAISGEGAPHPTDDEGRLNPELVRWMMGYPTGWVDGLSRTGQLRCLGNAIVPLQAATAWAHLLGIDFSAERERERERASSDSHQSGPRAGRSQPLWRIEPWSGADMPLIPTPTAWLGRRPCHGDGDPARWINPDRSSELSDFVAWLEVR